MMIDSSKEKEVQEATETTEHTVTHISTAEFIKSIIKFSIPSVVNFVLNFIFTIILTRLFAPELFGAINIFNTSVALIMSILSFGLDSGYIKFFNEAPQGFTRKKLFNIGILVGAIAILIIGILISVFFYKPFSMLIFKKTSQIVIILLFSNAIAQLVTRYFTITFRMNGNSLSFGILSIIIQVATKGIVIISAFFSSTFETVMLCNTAGIIVVAIFYLIFKYRKAFGVTKEIKINGNNKLKNLLIFSAFSWPILTIIYLNTFVTQIILNNKVSLTEVGIYSSVNIFIGIISVVTAGFSTYWSGFMYANYHKEQAKIIETHNYILMIGFTLFAILIIFKEVFFIAIGRDYHASKQFFAYSIIPSILALFMETTQYGISIKNKAYISLISYFLSLITNILICFWLVPKLNATGAAIASACSALILFVSLTLFGQINYKSIRTPLRASLVILLLVIIAVINHFFFYTIFSSIVIFLIYVVTMILLFRKENKVIIKIVCKYCKRKSK